MRLFSSKLNDRTNIDDLCAWNDLLHSIFKIFQNLMIPFSSAETSYLLFLENKTAVILWSWAA